jgi:hypothetical protein
MIELKQFHLYVKLHNSRSNTDHILSRFSGQYWSFGMHQSYLYNFKKLTSDLNYSTPITFGQTL